MQKIARSVAAVLALLFAAAWADEEAPGFRLADIIADHGVLQRDLPVPIWGTAEPGSEVTVEFADQKKTATADAKGEWVVWLAPMKASDEGRMLRVVNDGVEIRRIDLLVGEVWLASGQSNMGVPVRSVHDADEALKSDDDDALRLYRVPSRPAAAPRRDLKGVWESSTPKTIANASAVAWFFASEIRRTQKCPVGILQAPWGGTPIEAWISLAGFEKDPPLKEGLEKWKKALAKHREVLEDPDLMKEYRAALKAYSAKHKGDRSGYESDPAPEGVGSAAAKKPDAEPENPDPMDTPSPSRRPGTPTVLFNGMIAPVAPYALRGFLWYQGEANAGRGLDYRAQMKRLIDDWREHWKARLNGSASASAETPWFLWVQLPNCGPDPKPVATAGWPWLREAQALALDRPRTGMAVTIDIGDPRNVHPADKSDVARRLALIARRHIYGETLQASGPRFKSLRVEGASAELQFDEIGGGLIIGEAPWRPKGVEPLPTDHLVGFFVAGQDRQWYEATAEICGDKVVVSSPSVPQPVAVRYGWANSPRCNLYNAEHLPAAPFRTDDW